MAKSICLDDNSTRKTQEYNTAQYRQKRANQALPYQNVYMYIYTHTSTLIRATSTHSKRFSFETIENENCLLQHFCSLLCRSCYKTSSRSKIHQHLQSSPALMDSESTKQWQSGVPAVQQTQQFITVLTWTRLGQRAGGEHHLVTGPGHAGETCFTSHRLSHQFYCREWRRALGVRKKQVTFSAATVRSTITLTCSL